MTTCGVEHPTKPGVLCDRPFEPEHDPHQRGEGGLAERWPNRAFGASFNGVPPTRQGRDEAMLELVHNASRATRARIPDPPPHILARRTDPDTSQVAAATGSSRRGSERRRLYDALADAEPNGLARFQADNIIGLDDPYEASKRWSDLKTSGWAYISLDEAGEPVVRRSPETGKNQQVFRPVIPPPG